VQAVEMGDAVDPEQHRLAVDDELLVAVPQRRFDNLREAAGPVVAVAGEQAHAIAVALNDQTVAIVFD